MRRSWTEKEEKFLRDNYSSMTKNELAKHFNRTPKSVSKKIDRMGIRKRTSSSREWKREEIIELMLDYRIMTDREIAKKLNRSVASVSYKRRAMGLTK